MNKLLNSIAQIKKRYEDGENIINFLKKNSNSNLNDIESIMISYDLQAGSYTKAFDDYAMAKITYCKELVSYLDGLDFVDSFLLVGAGEAITLGNVISRLKNKPNTIFGFDISWSRIHYAKKFLERFNFNNVELSTGNIHQCPFPDNSIELVMSNHSLEPNGGQEKKILEELYRVSKKYIVINEPCYEFATEIGKRRIDKHGYVKNLHIEAKKLGFNILSHTKFKNPTNLKNPTSCLIIKKEIGDSEVEHPAEFACPMTKSLLEKNNDCYYSKDSFLAYPIIKGIPCLVPENAILASHYLV